MESLVAGFGEETDWIDPGVPLVIPRLDADADVTDTMLETSASATDEGTVLVSA